MTRGTQPERERGCDYCGLPLPGGRAPSEETSGPQYCCLGCSFAAKITAESGEAGEERLAMTKLGLAVFFAMSVMVFSLLLWSEGKAQQGPGGEIALASSFYDVARYLSLLFSIPVLFLLGPPVVENALRETLRGKLNTDVLLAAGVLASFGYSAYHVFIGEGHVYFEVACAILVAVTLGKWLEAHCKRQMTESLSALAKLLPSRVQVLDESGLATEKKLEEVAAGEVIRIPPGERVAVDGEILRGEGLLDEQILTGESEPASRGPGDRVLAGALNLDGELVIRSLVAGGQGAIQRIVDAVTAAARAKSKPQILAEKIAGRFLPLVILLSGLTLAYHGYYGGFYAGVSNALCVVLIACPCALGLATPLAIWAGIGRASREQILVREGDALCQLGNVRAIAFDKTGTLTTGASLVETHFHGDAQEEEHCRAIAKRLAASSQHLYCQTLRSTFAAAEEYELDDLRVAYGRGVSARDPLSGDEVRLGSRRFLRESGCEIPTEVDRQIDQTEAEGIGVSLLAIGRRPVATFLFSEKLREGAEEAIRSLREEGVELVLLSGDHPQRVAKIADRLGLRYQASMLPEEKLAALTELRKKYGPTAMVGDGVNDAPALSAADVGIALGCGADVSREAAAVCLLGNQLRRVADAIELGRQTQRTVRWNLIWTFAYNAAGISLAMTGRLHPAVAAVAMVASSLMVVIQSLRLANLEFPTQAAGKTSGEPDGETTEIITSLEAPLQTSHAA